MKTEVHFRSTAFNCIESRDYFINPGCWGDDVCQWLIGEIRRKGMMTDDEPNQEDFGWYFCFDVGGVSYCLVIGFQPNDPDSGDQWLGWIERDAGFFASLFGGRNRGIRVEATALIDQMLRLNPGITNVSWHDREE